ncbi:flippase [Haloarchaeobius sp. TZWSO28]|uniref:flippase n=1 Tax=Haloarchaeobius sp. TZWSO28 TaxID=3446119 RepID=UPI003EBC49A8
MKGLGKLAQSAGLVFVGTVFGQALGLVGELLIIRSVTPTTLGYLGVTYALVSTVGTIGLLGVPSGVTRFLSADKGNKGGTLLAGYLIGLGSAITLACGLFVTRFRIADVVGEPLISNLLPLFLPYLLALPVARITFSALRADQRTVSATVSKWIAPRLIALAILGVFLKLFNTPLVGAIGYWVSIPVLASLCALWFVKDNVPTMTVPTRQELRSLWRFSWPLAVGASLSMLLTRLDILMLSMYVESAAVGHYRSVQPLRQITTFVTGAFGFLFLPLATQYYETGDFDGLNRLYRTSTKWIVSLSLPFVLVFALFPRDVIRVFFGAKYLPASLALSILIAGLFFRALVGLDTDLLKALDRTRIELGCAIVGVVGNVIMNILLIPPFGIAGAAAATVSGFFIYNICEVAIIYKTVGTHPFGVNNLKPLLPTVLMSGAIATVVDSQLGLIELVAVGIVFSTFHLGSLIGTRSFDENDTVLIEHVEEKLGVDLSGVREFLM